MNVKSIGIIFTGLSRVDERPAEKRAKKSELSSGGLRNEELRKIFIEGACAASRLDGRQSWRLRLADFFRSLGFGVNQPE